MLRPDGYVKVLDFGIAKLAESAFAEPPSVAAATFGAGKGTPDHGNKGAISARSSGKSGLALTRRASLRAPSS
jgi:hypothetical protein